MYSITIKVYAQATGAMQTYRIDGQTRRWERDDVEQWLQRHTTDVVYWGHDVESAQPVVE